MACLSRLRNNQASHLVIFTHALLLLSHKCLQSQLCYLFVSSSIKSLAGSEKTASISHLKYQLYFGVRAGV